MEFYSEKYNNFIEHIEKIAGYYPDVNPWLEKLKTSDLTLFISLAQLSGMFDYAIECQKQGNTVDRNEAVEVIVEKFASENGFNEDSIDEADLMKLCRYCQLFTVMLSEL